MSKFVIKASRNGQYYFILKAPNGQTVIVSETYTSKQNCLNGINAVKKYAPVAKFENLS